MFLSTYQARVRGVYAGSLLVCDADDGALPALPEC